MQSKTDKLLSSFYTVKKQEIKKDIIHTILVFNENHEIYDGHFPNNPITPGVCLLQTAKELIEGVYNQSLVISNILNIKFLKLVIPNNNEMIFLTKLISYEKDLNKTITLTIKDQKGEIYTKANIVYDIVL